MCDWNEGSGHTSILVSKGATEWTTIDGNWGDAVTETTHAVSSLRKVWRIPGVDDAPQPKPKRLPPFVVATSHNGTRKILFRTHSKKRVANWLLHHTIAKIAPNGITIKRGKARKP